MENTYDNAMHFYLQNSEKDTFEIMQMYASACSAPSSIGEDEIRNKYPTTIAELGRKPDDTDEDGLFWYNHLRREGAEWAISRLSERKIVLPEGFKIYGCTNCKCTNILEDNKEITVGFCSYCKHPIWND